MTEVFEFGIGNAECGIEIGKMSDFYTLELEPCALCLLPRALLLFLFSDFRIPTSELLKPYTLCLLPSTLYLFRQQPVTSNQRPATSIEYQLPLLHLIALLL